jgi:hypothetical protein
MGRTYAEVLALFDAIARAWYATCLPTDTCRSTTPPVPRETAEILKTPRIAVLLSQRLALFLVRQQEEMRWHATRYLDVQQRKAQGYAPLSLQESQSTARLLDHQVRILHLPSTVEETVEHVAAHVTGIWAQLTSVERDDLLGLSHWHIKQYCHGCRCGQCDCPQESCRQCRITGEDL